MSSNGLHAEGEMEDLKLHVASCVHRYKALHGAIGRVENRLDKANERSDERYSQLFKLLLGGIIVPIYLAIVFGALKILGIM